MEFKKFDRWRGARQLRIQKKKIMARQSVLGIATFPLQAERIIRVLKEDGISKRNISALFPEPAASSNAGVGVGELGKGGEANGSSVLVGTLGWLACVGALALPEVGPLLAAGPLGATLSGAVGITGSLVGMGIPECEARHYESQVRKGGILLSVHTEDWGEAEQARKVFEHFCAQDIAVSAVAGRVCDGAVAESSASPAPHSISTSTSTSTHL